MQKVTLELENLKIFAYHGLYDHEKKDGQTFIVSIELNYIPIKNDDNIKNYIDYIDLHKFIINKFTERKFNLIEKAVDYVSKEISNFYKEVITIKISIRKPELIIDTNKNCILIKRSYKFK